MTDYLPFTPQEYEPDAPATALHFRRWFENPLAIAEDAPGAPKIKRRAAGGTTPAATQTFLSLDEYSGLDFRCAFQAASSSQLSLSFSSNGGGSWSTPVAFPAGTMSNGVADFSGVFDFATGRVVGIAHRPGATIMDNVAGFNFVLSGAGLTINAVRFSLSSSAALVALIWPNGGSL